MTDELNTDKITGRIKQAVGDLTNDKDLKNEGKVDEAAGKAKGLVGKLADTLKSAIDKLRGK